MNARALDTPAYDSQEATINAIASLLTNKNMQTSAPQERFAVSCLLVG